MRLLCLAFCFTAFICCHSNEKKEITFIENNRPDTLLTNKSNKPAILFDNLKPFLVVDAIRGITNSSAYDINMCKGWSLTAKEAAQIIKDAEPINGTIWHYQFLVLPCIVKGQIKQEDQTYKYEINGGSWISITSGDTTTYFGNYIKRNEKYFLEKADDHLTSSFFHRN